MEQCSEDSNIFRTLHKETYQIYLINIAQTLFCWVGVKAGLINSNEAHNNAINVNEFIKSASENRREAFHIFQSLNLENIQQINEQLTSIACILAILNKEIAESKVQSTYFATEAVKIFSSIENTTPETDKLKQEAEEILQYWAEQ